MQERTDPASPGAAPRRGEQLGRLFDPRSIAVVGASRDPETLGGRLLPILRQHGYPGAVHLVNPSGAPIAGEPTHPSVATVPGPVDLALVVVAARRVPEVLEQCGTKGVGAAIVLSSGFSEQDGGEGDRLQREVAAIARRYGMAVMGPNCEGFLNVAGHVPATFSPAVDLERALEAAPQPGGVAVVSQSGGLGFALFNDGTERKMRFSYVITTGNEADLDYLDALDFLVANGRSPVVLCFLEGLGDLGRFRDVAARARSTGTRLVVAKVGRSAAAARAALAHTAHEVGDPELSAEALSAPGVIAVSDQEELVDVGLALSRAPCWHGGGVAVVSISGGAGAWAADACFAAGLDVPIFDEELQVQLRRFMPPYGGAANPVDLTAQALATGGLAPPLELALGSPAVGAAMLVGSFGSPKQLQLEGDALGELVARSAKPIVVYSYTRPSAASVERFAEAGLAWYPSPARAARALAALRE